MTNDAMSKAQGSRSNVKNDVESLISMLIRFDSPRNSSPLTPALSPLRGEGVTLSALLDSQGCRRVRFVSDRIGTDNQNTTNAAKGDARIEAILRAPSPLNGERAGVRGEPTPDRENIAISPFFPPVIGHWSLVL